LNCSFFAQPHADVLRQQGHDDLTEEPHGVGAAGGAHGVADEGLHFVLGNDLVEEEQRLGTAAEAALRAAGGIETIPWLKQRHVDSKVRCRRPGSEPVITGTTY
jgi:hypothetical protein